MYQKPGNAEFTGNDLLDQLDHIYFHSLSCFPGKIPRSENDRLVIERKKSRHELSKGCPCKGKGLVQHQCGQNPLIMYVVRLLLSPLRLDALFIALFIIICSFFPSAEPNKPGEQ